MLYLELFDRGYINRSPVKGISTPRELNYLRRIYIHNRDVLKRYYSSRNFAVKGTHVISRLLGHIPLKENESLFDFIYLMEDRLDYLGKLFQFTSGIEKGVVHPPHFYGNGGNELIYADSELDHLSKTATDWKNYKCIEAITHPRDDLRLLLPFGTDDGSNGGLSSVKIDLLGLAIMYRGFMIEYRSVASENPIAYSKNVFVAKYVLPSFLESDIDHRFLNRIMNNFYDRQEAVPRYKHKTTILEPTDRVDKYVNDVVDNITRGDYSFTDILFNIPLIFKVNAADLLAFDDTPNTRQSNWFFIVSRLKYMCFLYDVAKNKRRNNKYIKDWGKLVRRIENDSALFTYLSPELHKEVKGYIEKIKRM